MEARFTSVVSYEKCLELEKSCGMKVFPVRVMHVGNENDTVLKQEELSGEQEGFSLRSDDSFGRPRGLYGFLEYQKLIQLPVRLVKASTQKPSTVCSSHMIHSQFRRI